MGTVQKINEANKAVNEFASKLKEAIAYRIAKGGNYDLSKFSAVELNNELHEEIQRGTRGDWSNKSIEMAAICVFLNKAIEEGRWE